MFDHVEFLSDPTQWPGTGSKRACAVKNYNGSQPGGFPPLENFGMLISVNGKVFTNDGCVIIFRDGFEPLAYATIEAMVADGWEVD